MVDGLNPKSTILACIVSIGQRNQFRLRCGRTIPERWRCKTHPTTRLLSDWIWQRGKSYWWVKRGI